jgi:hypothetical protein
MLIYFASAQFRKSSLPDVNINFGPIDGVIWPIKGDMQNTTAG